MAKSNFGLNIKTLREINRITQQQLADALDVTQNTIGGWETRNKKPRSQEIVDAICTQFDVTERDLFGFSDGLYAKTHGLTNMVEFEAGDSFRPLVGVLAGGEPRMAFEINDEQHYVNPNVLERYPDGKLFMVAGESMNKVLPNGAYVYLADPDKFPARTGDVVGVQVNGDDATIKRIKFFDGLIILEPESTLPDYKRIVIDEDDPDAPAVRIIGKVVWHEFEGDL